MTHKLKEENWTKPHGVRCMRTDDQFDDATLVKEP